MAISAQMKNLADRVNELKHSIEMRIYQYLLIVIIKVALKEVVFNN